MSYLNTQQWHGLRRPTRLIGEKLDAHQLYSKPTGLTPVNPFSYEGTIRIGAPYVIYGTYPSRLPSSITYFDRMTGSWMTREIVPNE